MTDPITAAAANEVAKLGGGIVGRLLGPVADDMGQELLAKYRNRNVRKVLGLAESKTPEGSIGGIPPRVAAEIFDKSQWADDEFVAEYLSGVLASARTVDGIDDSAVSWTALVGRLSSDQLRLHHVLYSLVRSKFVGKTFDNSNDWEVKRFLVTYTDLLGSLGWQGQALATESRLLDALYGLEREQIIGDIGHGSRAFWQKYWVPRQGKVLPEGDNFVIFHATTVGALLYLRAHGHSNLWSTSLLDPTFAPTFAGPAEELPGDLVGVLVEDLPDLSKTEATDPALGPSQLGQG